MVKINLHAIKNLGLTGLLSFLMVHFLLTSQVNNSADEAYGAFKPSDVSNSRQMKTHSEGENITVDLTRKGSSREVADKKNEPILQRTLFIKKLVESNPKMAMFMDSILFSAERADERERVGNEQLTIEALDNHQALRDLVNMEKLTARDRTIIKNIVTENYELIERFNTFASAAYRELLDNDEGQRFLMEFPKTANQREIQNSIEEWRRKKTIESFEDFNLPLGVTVKDLERDSSELIFNNELIMAEARNRLSVDGADQFFDSVSLEKEKHEEMKIARKLEDLTARADLSRAEEEIAIEILGLNPETNIGKILKELGK